jgi:hypothetical protein
MKKIAIQFFCTFLTFAGWGQSFNLNVSNGYGTGTYSEGDTIYIWSNPEFQNYSFEGWQGSATNYVLEQHEWLTRVVVPHNSNVETFNLSAEFNDITHSVTIGSEAITLPGMDNGTLNLYPKDVYYQIPENPIGIIFCFHGTGGSGAGFQNDFEKNHFSKLEQIEIISWLQLKPMKKLMEIKMRTVS